MNGETWILLATVLLVLFVAIACGSYELGIIEGERRMMLAARSTLQERDAE